MQKGDSDVVDSGDDSAGNVKRSEKRGASAAAEDDADEENEDNENEEEGDNKNDAGEEARF